MFALAVWCLLPGCGEYALVKSLGNSVDINQIREREGLNLWSDENAVAARTKYLISRVSAEDARPVAVVAPAWSYGGIAVRIASPITGDILYQPELQVAALSDSGVQLTPFINNEQAQFVGVFPPDWYRVPLSAPMLDKARTAGLDVRVECEVGTWNFRMTPGYFRGYELKLPELQKQTLRLLLSDQHQPPSP